MAFIDEYKALYNDTLRKIKENRDEPYECLLIKREYEAYKKHLIEKYKKINND